MHAPVFAPILAKPWNHQPRPPIAPAKRLPLTKYSQHRTNRAPLQSCLAQHPAHLWFTAAKNSDIPTLTKLIRSGKVQTTLITDDLADRTALHYAASSADVATIRALYELARGVGGVRQDFKHHTEQALALVNMPDNEQKTALHFAAVRTDPHAQNVVSTLVALGADVSARDRRGLNPIDVAVLPGVVDLLNGRL